MNGVDTIEVSAVVVALMYLLRWSGVPHRLAPIIVPVASALGVGLWWYAHGGFGRADTFSYVAAWIAVSTASATVWGFRWAAANPAGEGS